MSEPIDLSTPPSRLRSGGVAVRRMATTMSIDGAAERLAERLQRRRDADLLARARDGREVCWVDGSQDEPLVTVRVITYDRPELLLERALPSILAQTYQNLDVLVVGDACDARTEQAVAQLRDPRLRYVNLGRRPLLPDTGWRRWAQIGVDAHNVGLALGRGAWFLACDDDDALLPDAVERLLSTAIGARVELAHARTLVDLGDGRQGLLGLPVPRRGQTTHGSVLFSAGLRFFRYRATCGALGETQDWNLWRRMLACGVTAAATDAVTYRYVPTGPTQTAFRRVADRVGG